MLSEADQKVIEAAVARAEEKTAGEIVCIVAQRVSTYPEISVAWAAAGALVVPVLLVWVGISPAVFFEWARGWTASAGLRGMPITTAFVAEYAIIQAVIFLAVVFLASIPSIRAALTPAALKKRRVYQAAYEQYLATGLHQANERTGVVIFACLDDRCVSIIADELIHKIVGNEIWGRAVAAVQDGMATNSGAAGFVQAIEICGAALAQHFPGKSANALSDKPLIL
jgi:putative membrane protein